MRSEHAGSERFLDHLKEAGGLILELEGHSDREIAIVACAILDEALRLVLRSKMIKINRGQDKEIFEGNGPLANFSSRIGIAYCFGAIPETVQKNLHILRKVRNEFAHNMTHCSFADQKIRKLCETLTFIDEASLFEEINFLPFDGGGRSEKIETDAFRIAITDEEGYAFAVIRNRSNLSDVNKNNFLNAFEYIWAYLVIIS